MNQSKGPSPRKIPPLQCPKCGSTQVSRGLTKRRRNAFCADDKIYGEACKLITNTKTGKTKYLERDFKY